MLSRNGRLTALITVMVLSLLAMMACSQPAAAPTPTKASAAPAAAPSAAPAAAPTSAAAAPAATKPAAAAPATGQKLPAPKKVMSAGSQQAGSLYVTYVTAWSKLMMDNFDVNMTVEPGGSSQNVQLTHQGKMEFGITSSSQCYQGFYGIGWAKEKYDKIRALFPAYPAIMALAVKDDSPIKSVRDLEGKRVHVGPAGSGTDVLMRQWFDLFGYKPARIINANNEDAGGMMRDGLIDAFMNIGGHPMGPLQELELSQKLRFVAFDKAEMAKFQEKYPYYAMGTLKSGTYKGLTEDQQTMVIMNYIIGAADLSDDFVYNVVARTFADVKKIHDAHKSFVDTDPKNVGQIPTPFHPGAEKYYKEKGIQLPKVVPPTS